MVLSLPHEPRSPETERSPAHPRPAGLALQAAVSLAVLLVLAGPRPATAQARGEGPASRPGEVSLPQRDGLAQSASAARASLDAAPATPGWRQAEAPAGNPPAATAAEVVAAPRVAARETVVRRRLTTTLLTVDGTLLHQERLELAQAGEVLSLTLPQRSVLWSATVDGQPVRPLPPGAQRSGAGDAAASPHDVSPSATAELVVVPLGAGGARVVEVVAVLEQGIATGPSWLAIELARLHAPVLEHRWRLLLPENASYRVRTADLRPEEDTAVAAPPVAGQPVPAARDPWQILQSAPGSPSDGIATGGNAQAPPSGFDLAPFVNAQGNEQGRQSAYIGPAVPDLRGHVTDPAGAPLPGVTVTLTGERLKSPLNQVTNANGDYLFPGLARGTYEVEAELKGFGPVEAPSIRVEGYKTSLDLTLTPSPDAIAIPSEAGAAHMPALRTDPTVKQDEPRHLPAAKQAPIGTLEDLRQSLTGNVQPPPVTIPRSAKLLLLAGKLPPERVAVELDIQPIPN